MEEILRRSTLFRRLAPGDRQRLAAVATVRGLDKGATLFSEGEGSQTMVRGSGGRFEDDWDDDRNLHPDHEPLGPLRSLS